MKFDTSFYEDKDFLQALSRMPIQVEYIKITSLDFQENPIREIEGTVISGNINLDGKSSVRRTANLSFVVSDNEIGITELDSHLSMNKKIAVEIGVENRTEFKEYDDIIYFPMGIFVICDASLSNSTGGLTASLNLKDKMVLLNGECGGVIPAAVSLDTLDEMDENGLVYRKKLPIFQIIQELVSEFGKESLSKIFINDVELQIKQIMKWIGDSDLYVVDQGQGAYNVTLNINDAKGEVIKIKPGDNIGYIYTDFYYPEELNADAGSSITNALDKIKELLGNYEYYYDINGNFIFQEIRNYLNTSKSTLDLKDIVSGKLDSQQIAEYFLELNYLTDITQGKESYKFNDASLFTNINHSPQYNKVKNDFVIWGVRKNVAGGTYPIRYHLAIDEKPAIGDVYKNIIITKDDEGYYHGHQIYDYADEGITLAQLFERTYDPAEYYYSAKKDDNNTNIYYKNDEGGYDLFLDSYDSKKDFPKVPVNITELNEILSSNDINNIQDTFIDSFSKVLDYGYRKTLVEALAPFTDLIDKELETIDKDWNSTELLAAIESFFLEADEKNKGKKYKDKYFPIWEKFIKEKLFANAVPLNTFEKHLYTLCTADYSQKESKIEALIFLIQQALKELIKDTDSTLSEKLNKNIVESELINVISRFKISGSWQGNLYHLNKILTPSIIYDSESQTYLLKPVKVNNIIQGVDNVYFTNNTVTNTEYCAMGTKTITDENKVEKEVLDVKLNEHFYKIFMNQVLTYKPELHYYVFSKNSSTISKLQDVDKSTEEVAVLNPSIAYYLEWEGKDPVQDMSADFNVQVISTLADYFLNYTKVYTSAGLTNRKINVEKNFREIVSSASTTDTTDLLYWVIDNSYVRAEYNRIKNEMAEFDALRQDILMAISTIEEILPYLKDLKVLESSSTTAGMDGKSLSKHSKRYYHDRFWRHHAIAEEYNLFLEENKDLINYLRYFRSSLLEKYLNTETGKKNTALVRRLSNWLLSMDASIFELYGPKNYDIDMLDAIGGTLNISGNEELIKLTNKLNKSYFKDNNLSPKSQSIEKDDFDKVLSKLDEQLFPYKGPKGDTENQYNYEYRVLDSLIKKIYNSYTGRDVSIYDKPYYNADDLKAYKTEKGENSNDYKKAKSVYEHHFQKRNYHPYAGFKPVKVRGRETSGNKPNGMYLPFKVLNKTTNKMEYIPEGTYFLNYAKLRKASMAYWADKTKDNDTKFWQCQEPHSHLSTSVFGPYCRFVSKQNERDNTHTYTSTQDRHIPCRSIQVYENAKLFKERNRNSYNNYLDVEKNYISIAMNTYTVVQDMIDSISSVCDHLIETVNNSSNQSDFLTQVGGLYNKYNESLKGIPELSGIITNLDSFIDTATKLKGAYFANRSNGIGTNKATALGKETDLYANDDMSRYDPYWSDVSEQSYIVKATDETYEHIVYSYALEVKDGITLRQWVDKLIADYNNVLAFLNKCLNDYDDTRKKIIVLYKNQLRKVIEEYVVLVLDENNLNEWKWLHEIDWTDLNLAKDKTIYHLLYAVFDNENKSWKVRKDDLLKISFNNNLNTSTSLYDEQIGEMPTWYLKDRTANKIYYFDINTNDYIEEPYCGPHDITVKDWRTALYMQGVCAELNGTASNDYFVELKNEWPKLYNIVDAKFNDNVIEDITSVNYFLDFIDSGAEMAEFSINNIGKRSMVLNNNDINCIFEPYVPDYVIVSTDDENREKKVAEYQNQGYTYIQVQPSIYNQLATGTYFNSAYVNMQDVLRENTDFSNNVSISSVPMYYLQPNTRIALDDYSTGVKGDYMIDSISHALGVSGTMNLNCTKSIDRI